MYIGACPLPSLVALGGEGAAESGGRGPRREAYNNNNKLITVICNIPITIIAVICILIQ